MVRTASMLALVAQLVAADPARANGGPVDETWREIDADALVARCWGISREDRGSGVTARMRAGTVDTIDCLAEEIVRQAGAFFSPRSMSGAEVRQALEDIGAAYGKLYWTMHNEHQGCDPNCGTVYHTFHVAAIAGLFQRILRDLVAQRNEYRE